jgi:O-antigen/teichoic acid export membrane protein
MLKRSLKPFDANGTFRPVGATTEFRRRAVRSAGVTVLSQGVVFGTQMIATVVLARLLAPADFGVVTMVTTFSLLIMGFGQNGYSEAVIQRDDIDESLASNLFWINVSAGLVLTLIFAASGSLLAKFYGDPRVAYIAAGMSLTILLNSTSVIHLALLKRALHFSVTSANDIFATTVSVSSMILLASRGWGYWALVAGAVIRLFVQAAGAWYLCRWIPSFPRRMAGTASVVRFALNVYGRFSFNYLTRNTDNLLVGWRFGSSSLGFYKKAYDLFLLPANQLAVPVSDVVLSTLSRLERGSAQYKRYFLNGLSILAFVGMGAGAALTLMGRDLIRVLLGPKWGPAGQIFTFFGPGIGIMLIYTTSGAIHLSIGRADRWFRWVVLEFSVTVLLFLLGLHWGPTGIAAAWTASFWLLTIPAFWYAGKPINFGVGPVIASVWRYVLASALAGGATAAGVRTISSLEELSGAGGAMLRIVVTASLFSVLYVGAVILLHGGLGPLHRLLSLLPDMLPWKKASKPPLAPESETVDPETVLEEDLSAEDSQLLPEEAR